MNEDDKMETNNISKDGKIWDILSIIFSIIHVGIPLGLIFGIIGLYKYTPGSNGYII
jgi:hypothetical protein